MAKASEPSQASSRRSRFGVRRLRWLLLTVMALALVTFCGGVVWLVQQIFDDFGPAVRKDLAWQAVRGAQELARNADVGLTVSDTAMVTRAFGDFRESEDVIAIVAVDGSGAVVAVHGNPPEAVDSLYAGPSGIVREGRRCLVSWATATIEGRTVGKVALVVSTRRLTEAQALLRRISTGTVIAGLLALLFGIVFVNYFTGTIAARDAQLAGYAVGLEGKIAERTAELDRRNRAARRLLDNVEQGFLAVSLDGVILSERSTVVDRWFGVPPSGARFDDYIRAADSAAAEWFTIGLEALAEGILPEEVLLDQLPKKMARGGRTLRLTYTPIADGDVRSDTPRSLLIVMTDITDELARERMERDTREMMQIFDRMTHDRAGMQQFFAEAGRLVQQLGAPGDDVARDLRLTHTLKGNCGQLGLESMAELCHAAETEMQEGRRPLDISGRDRIASRWEQLRGLAAFAWADQRPSLHVGEGDLERVLEALRARAPNEDVIHLVESWRLEPVTVRFARLADNARYTCKRLGKPIVTVHTEAGGVRLDSERWAPFWAALVHAINNALDHGIEDEQTRAARGKPGNGTLWLTAAREVHDGRPELTVAVRDDGGGLDWQRLAVKASARGLPCASHEDLVEAMFAEGISTRARVEAISGRGVGLSALRETTRALGGHIEVSSDTGLGTTMRFRFPCATAAMTVAA